MFHRNARVCFYEENIFIILSESEVYELANIKSAKKRILVNRTKAARNKAIKSAVKTSMKKVEAAVAQNDKAAAEAALKDAISTISKATSKGVYHKNNCARKVSHLTKAVNSIG
jgi:small subunit ribosomal protein S20